MDYQQYLIEKQKEDVGSELPITLPLFKYHMPFQKASVLWAASKGRAVLAEDCGLGKGLQQLELGHQIIGYTKKPVIMFAPPAVKAQFKLEAAKFEFEINVIEEEYQIEPSLINVTNYERLTVRENIKVEDYKAYLDKWQEYAPIEVRRTDSVVTVDRFRFAPKKFGGLIGDELSILKHYNAATREALTRFVEFGNIQYRFGGSATPAPNDFIEWINYSEFLGIMTGTQARAKYFIQDGNSSNKYKLMPHAREDFYKWIASFALLIRLPSDLGYDDNGFILPPKRHHLCMINDWRVPDGEMFSRPAKSLSEQSKLKRDSLEERCQVAADLVNGDVNYAKWGILDDLSKERWIVWVKLNNEGELLNKLIPDSIEVSGSHSEAYKERAFIDFREGRGSRVLITKIGIGGLGMNWQAYCRASVEVSVDHSHEDAKQSAGRIWRFGQTKECHLFTVAMNTEGNILANRERKEKQDDEMYKAVKKYVHTDNKIIAKQETPYKMEITSSNPDLNFDNLTLENLKKTDWTLMLGDSCETLNHLPDMSVGHVITSVPFPAMYAYTDSSRDIGNYDDIEDACRHMGFVFKALLPKMMPSRIVSIHLAQAVAHMNREGYIGLEDFRGPLVRIMKEAGYYFHGERTIEKDPQTERARNNTYGLLFKTVANDAAMLRASTSDYLIDFRVPGDDIEPIKALLATLDTGCRKYDCPDGWITEPMWINWASNVWYKYRRGMKWWEGIEVTNVLGAHKGALGVRDARGKDDIKHLCELQLDVIERSIALHSNPGDLIVDPFNGIYSSGWQAALMGRRYLGSELKEEYYRVSIKNALKVALEVRQKDMFTPRIDQGDYLSISKRWMTKRGISVLDEFGKYNDRTEWRNWQPLTEYNEEMEQLALL
jgi:DNA methylase